MNIPEPGGDPGLDIINLSQDHMVDHPAGAHYVLWNRPAFLDVGICACGRVCPLCDRQPDAAVDTVAELAAVPPAPVAARYDGRGLAILLASL